MNDAEETPPGVEVDDPGGFRGLVARIDQIDDEIEENRTFFFGGFVLSLTIGLGLVGLLIQGILPALPMGWVQWVLAAMLAALSLVGVGLVVPHLRLLVTRARLHAELDRWHAEDGVAGVDRMEDDTAATGSPDEP